MAESKEKKPFTTADTMVATVLKCFGFPYSMRKGERGVEFVFTDREDGTDVFEFSTRRLKYDRSLTVSVNKFLDVRKKLMQELRDAKQ